MSQRRNRAEVTSSESSDFALAVHELLRRVRFDDVRTVCSWGLTRTECHVLEVVALDGPLTVTDVASRIRLDKSTASRVVGSLTEKKLLRRKTAGHDARALAVEVTAPGRTLWRSIVDASAAAYSEVLAECTAEERKMLMRVLARIAAYATEPKC
jgi:DNA-binding MarR family transcriptional regulator